MEDEVLKQHILDSKDEIISESVAYYQKASARELSDIWVHSILKSGATKDDMVKLYERKFLVEGEGGRKYYDAIKLLFPNDRCPYCAQHEVNTLDD